MTINSDLSRARYVGNGVTATFAIPFAYLTNSDGTAQVAVYVGDSDVALVEGKDYTVKGFGKYSDASDQIDEDLITYETRYENGEFTLVNVPALGQAVVVIRDVPQTQGIVFVEGEKFPAQDYENGLDKLTMEVQEVKENLTRAIVLPPTSTDNPLEIRGDILKAANEAKTIAETAIRLVEGAPEVIASETDKAVNTIGNFTDEKTAAFNELVETKTEEFEQTAITATEQAVGIVERSRIWAEGEQAEVEPLGGTLSSMGAADLAYAIANAPEDTPIDASGLFAMNVVKGEKGDKGDKGEDGKDGGGLEIGDVAFAVMGIDETKNLRRYLNGQVISQSQFVSFTNWVKERANLYPNIIATEENWQAEVTNSKLGQCGKFVIDDELGTIRLPKVVNINGLMDLMALGSVKGESLPNHNHTSQELSGINIAVSWSDGNILVLGTVYRDAYIETVSIDNPTYQDNAPVQQEAIQYPYFIQVATGVEESVDVTREIELNNPFSLLDYKWSEYELNNASWLISNGSFHSGATYVAVYELLLKIYNGTETKDGVSVKLASEEYSDTDFVLNTADTTFRLPIKVKLASGNMIVGNGMTLGWTNGTNNYGTVYRSNTVTRLSLADAAYGNEVGPTYNDTITNGGHLQGFGVTTDPTKSGIETSSSGLKLYFYVGETIQDANVIAASQVLTRVANGIDRTSATDRETVVGWGMPDYSAIIKGISFPYTAPTNGEVRFNLDSDTTAYVNGNLVDLGGNDSYNEGPVALRVSKGDVVQLTGTSWSQRFIPYKGV